jgi:N-acetylmuramoyl-L-alanine amidase
MARMPGAQWRPVPNCTDNGQEAVYGVVLHIMEGTLDGSDAWFRNTKSQASAHFGVGKDGRIYQWVDTKDRAWAESAGNRTWLSIEHEGRSGDSLTPAQLAATARIVAWMHQVHGFPLQITDSVTGRGIGWHGMGGAAWGGHYDCPGSPIKAQRADIIAAAKGGSTEDDMDATQARQLAELHSALVPYAGWSYKGKGETQDAYAYLRGTSAAVRSLTAQVGALTAAVAALAQDGGLPLAQVQAAAEAGAKAALAELGDALTKEGN